MTSAQINRMLREWMKTPEGKRAVDEYVEEAQEKGSSLPGAKKGITKKDMRRVANIFAEMLRSKMPESIAEVGAALSVGEPKKGEGFYTVTLSFDKEAIRRESLESDEPQYKKYGGHTGPGIDNIVALFNNGYSEDEIGKVWGVWASHDAYIHNRTQRDGLYFMQEAAHEFNAMYGKKYGVTVVLGSDYTKN